MFQIFLNLKTFLLSRTLTVSTTPYFLLTPIGILVYDLDLYARLLDLAMKSFCSLNRATFTALFSINSYNITFFSGLTSSCPVYSYRSQAPVPY